MADRKPTILVTGATDGLGLATAQALGAQGATILLHGREPARIAAAADAVRQTGAAEVRTYQGDFASLRDVAALADAILAKEERLDVLINNAGLGVEDHRRTSADGHEMLFQVDYLAPFLLTRRLLPLLERSRPARVVNVASAGQAPIDFDDVMLERHWDGVQSYCQAKLAEIMMAFDMADDLARRGITINALHPASMMPTKIVTGRYSPQSDLADGVRNVVRLATDVSLEGVTGRYFNGSREDRANAQAYDGDARAELRRISIDLTSVQEPA